MLKRWVVLEGAIDITARAGAILLSKVQIDGANFFDERSVFLIDEKVGGHSLCLPTQIELKGVLDHVVLQPSDQKFVWPVSSTDMQVRLRTTQRLSCFRMLSQLSCTQLPFRGF